MPHDVGVLLLPGLGDSGPQHWQSHWERRDEHCQRVVQTEWDAPLRSDWVSCLDAALLGVDHAVVLAGHSLGCALVAHWAVSAPPAHLARVRGALLVAPADPAGEQVPAGPEGFSPMPCVRLPFPTIVVASDNDPYLSPVRARHFARAWGSRYVELAGAAHVNTEAGFGPWPEGWSLLEELRAAPASDPAVPWWLANEASLDAFLAAFEDGSFPIAWWTHGAHVAMAAAILFDAPVPSALARIGRGIRAYNLSQGGANTAAAGYHETLTRLWVGAVAAALATVPDSCTRLAAVRRVHGRLASRSTLFRDWYAHDLLRDGVARREWVPPDATLAGEAGPLFADL